MVLRYFTRTLHATTRNHTFSWRAGQVLSGRTLSLLALGTSPFLLSLPIHLDSDRLAPPPNKNATTLRELIRTYVVYTMCSSETLVDFAPKSLEVLSRVPLIKQITEALVRVTFFDQFVGGDTAIETLPLMRKLRAANKGTLFAYSVEVDESPATKNRGPPNRIPAYKRSIDEMIRCIDVAADFEDSILGASSTIGRRTWVAIKLTALLPDAQALIRLSSAILETRRSNSPIPFPGCPQSSDLDVLYSPSQLSADDVKALRELHSDLHRICKRAEERGVKIIVDAEYSWYQPSIDAYQLSLMREFNKLTGKGIVQPLIYGTFQAYLRRTPLHLAQSFADAESNNYALGVKLVRGAYHPHELAAHEGKKNSISISPDPHPPVWATKDETDKTYNASVRMLIRKLKADIQSDRSLQRVGILFGTHNWDSCKLILKLLVDEGLGSVIPGTDVVQIPDAVTERLTMGQLYGMSDALTDYLVDHTRSNAPTVIKYVPYGALSEVMPYLGRRAIENKSVLGSGTAAEERRRAGTEIRKIVFG